MAENKMMVRVIAPERVFYEGEASFLEFNTIEGIIGLYPKHIPMTEIPPPQHAGRFVRRDILS